MAKHRGSVMEHSKERILDLMRAYDEHLAKCNFIKMPDVYKHVVNMPSSRFWVSDTRAALVVSALMRGEIDLDDMWPTRKEMYEEIYRRVLNLKEQEPKLSITELTAIVVAQPAPKFYLTPGSAKVMICKARRGWVRKKLKDLRLF